jgi:hypothetical protein
MAVDKVLHNYRTPLRTSYLTSARGITVDSFDKVGVLISNSAGVLSNLNFENQSNYYLSNDGTNVVWKKPTWLETAAPSPTTRLSGASITLPSEYRRITISQNSPQSYDGAEGDIWLTFL